MLKICCFLLARSLFRFRSSRERFDTVYVEGFNYLKDCKSFNVFPKFIYFPLPNVKDTNVNAIGRRLLSTFRDIEAPPRTSKREL